MARTEGITLAEVQARAWANKKAKGFSTDDIPQEFMLTVGELGEAIKAYWTNSPDLGSELADVAIYVACLAEMNGIDLDTAVMEKLALNESRTYVADENGRLVKEMTTR